MLQEFGIPAGVNLIAVTPEEYKLGDLLLRKFQIDICQSQDVIDILTGLPVLGNTPGFCIVLQCRAIAQPLAFYVLDKLAVPGATYLAALLPVNNKFRNGILHKGLANPGVLN